MIFNIALGGVAYISVTAPSGASISATCSGVTKTGTGSCTLEVPVIGTWSVTCTYSGVSRTNSISVSSYGTTYNAFFALLTTTAPSGASISCDGQTGTKLLVSSTGNLTVTCLYDGTTRTKTISVSTSTLSYNVNFTGDYVCTIVVTCPAGASVVASRSGYSNVTGTGSCSLSVPKSGNWTVTVTIGSGTGQESKSGTVSAVYGGSSSISLYPKFWIYRAYGNYKGAGLELWDADGVGSAVSFGSSYADYTCSDGGNNTLIASNDVNLTGYSTMYIHCKLVYANRVELGLTTYGNRSDSDNWAYRNKIHNLVSPDNRVSWDWANYSISISSTASIRPVLLNLGGGYIPGISQDKDSEVQIDQWWLE